MGLLESLRDKMNAAPGENATETVHPDTNKPRTPREKKPTNITLAEVADDDILAVRNCSTNEVMGSLKTALSYQENTAVQSGRYLKINKADLPAFTKFASEGGFYVKESRVGQVVIYDLMVDNSNRFHKNGKRG